MLLSRNNCGQSGLIGFDMTAVSSQATARSHRITGSTPSSRTSTLPFIQFKVEKSDITYYWKCKIVRKIFWKIYERVILSYTSEWRTLFKRSKWETVSFRLSVIRNSWVVSDKFKSCISLEKVLLAHWLWLGSGERWRGMSPTSRQKMWAHIPSPRRRILTQSCRKIT